MLLSIMLQGRSHQKLSDQVEITGFCLYLTQLTVFLVLCEVR